MDLPVKEIYFFGWEINAVKSGSCYFFFFRGRFFLYNVLVSLMITVTKKFNACIKKKSIFFKLPKCFQALILLGFWHFLI